MARYIDANKIHYHQKENIDGYIYSEYVSKDEIDAVPTEDVEPVRCGEWIKKDTRFESGMKDGASLWAIQSWYCICSECNKIINNKQFEEVPDFCPYCGSKNEIRKGDE